MPTQQAPVGQLLSIGAMPASVPALIDFPAGGLLSSSTAPTAACAEYRPRYTAQPNVRKTSTISLRNHDVELPMHVGTLLTAGLGFVLLTGCCPVYSGSGQPASQDYDGKWRVTAITPTPLGSIPAFDLACLTITDGAITSFDEQCTGSPTGAYNSRAGVITRGFDYRPLLPEADYQVVWQFSATGSHPLYYTLTVGTYCDHLAGRLVGHLGCFGHGDCPDGGQLGDAVQDYFVELRRD